MTCINALTLELSEGEVPTEGDVIVNDMPVCADESSWNLTEAQVYFSTINIIDKPYFTTEMLMRIILSITKVWTP